MPVQERQQILTQAELERLTRLQKKWKQDGSHDDIKNDIPKDTFVSDFQRIDELQRQFNRKLGLPEDRKELMHYNPVFARFQFEKARTEKERKQFLRSEEQQLQTVYRERWRTRESVSGYSIDEQGKLRNKDWQREPFEDVILRGIMMQKDANSKEQEREESELVGFRKIQQVLTNAETPKGTKMVLISPPSTKEESPYKLNFVDIFEKTEQGVKATRFMLPKEFDRHEEVAKSIDSKYFQDEKGSRDAWYLARPIQLGEEARFKSPTEILDKLFEKDRQAMQEEAFQEIYKTCVPMVNYYLSILCQEQFDPVAIAKAFNAVLNKGDEVVKDWKEGKSSKSSAKAPKPIFIYKDIKKEAEYYGRMPVAVVATNCRESGGFAMSGAPMNRMSPFGNPTEGVTSVAYFGIDYDKYGNREFNCPSCLQKNRRPYNELLKYCQHCRSTSVACEI